MGLDRETCYRAVAARDARFDGRFFTCVRSTGVYCRPVCPARTPKLQHCTFVTTAAAAHELGFRPCLRCHPEASPGCAVWRGTSNTVARALRLIEGGALDSGSVDELGERVGVGGRHLRRLFEEHCGAAPAALAQTRRILFAKRLIHETALPITDIAFAAGFQSVRRFNDAMRTWCGRAPRELRRERAAEASDARGIMLRLHFRPPFDFRATLDFLRGRAVAGVEEIDDERYARGAVEVRAAAGANYVIAQIGQARATELAGIVARVRRMFDLDADMSAINAHLARDRVLKPLVAKRPGLRVPGGWDAFETAVRAIVGQQVSVAAASTFMARIVAIAPLRAEAIAQADLAKVGLTRARAEMLRAFARAVAEDARLLETETTLAATEAKLGELPGIGPWTASYIAMRALGEPDAFPASDLGLRRALAAGGAMPGAKEVLERAERWRPWRAYAAMQLWNADRDRS